MTAIKSKELSLSIPWAEYIRDRALSANQIARIIKKEGKWVHKYIPDEFRAEMLRNGHINRTTQWKGKRWSAS